MAKQSSFIKTFLRYVVFLSSFGCILLGYLWFSDIYQTFNQKSALIRSQHFEDQKEMLVMEVERAMAYIEFMRQRSDTLLRKNLRQRTLEGHAIAGQVYDKFQGQLTDQEIKRLIIETLRSGGFFEGRGYYFITDMQGICQLFPDRPQLEGQYIGDLKSIDGQSVILDMIALSRNRGEGFYEYRWTKPGSPGADHRKVSYIKHFKPFDWYIGTGEYPENIQQEIQAEVISRLEQIKFGNDGYIFAGQFDGISLSGPAKGRNMYNVQDINGIKIVQELIKVAQDGGGFVEYTLPKFKGQRSAPKLSYAISIPDWQWYIGAGMYRADIEQIIDQQKETLNTRTRKNILEISLVILITIVATFILSRILVRRFNRTIRLFNSFFERAANDAILIDSQLLPFTEFHSLASSANQMLTERRRAEEELQDTRNLLKSILDSTPSILAGVDRQLRISHWNRAAAELSGVAPQDAIGRPLGSLLPVFSTRQEAIKAAIHNQRATFEHEISCMAKGKERFFDISIHPQISAAGAVIKMDDVTEKKRLQSLMVQSEKMLSIGGLAAGMAHEINNPLAGILQNIQVIQNRLNPGIPKNRSAAEECGCQIEQIEQFMHERGIYNMLNAIQISGSQAAAIVDTLLTFSRGDESRFKHHDIKELVGQTIQLANNSISNLDRVQIIEDFAAKLPQIPCIGSQICQVLLAIIKNAAQAIEATSNPGVISIAAQRKDDKLEISIADNGCGMPDEVSARIFEPFFTTHDIQAGTGLGLSVAYFIITNIHHGQLIAESSPSQGSRLTILLPLERRRKGK